jgi:hypothetical protein
MRSAGLKALTFGNWGTTMIIQLNQGPGNAIQSRAPVSKRLEGVWETQIFALA